MFNVGLADGVGATLGRLETTGRGVDDISDRRSNVVIVEVRHDRMNVKLINAFLECFQGNGGSIAPMAAFINSFETSGVPKTRVR